MPYWSLLFVYYGHGLTINTCINPNHLASKVLEGYVGCISVVLTYEVKCVFTTAPSLSICRDQVKQW